MSCRIVCEIYFLLVCSMLENVIFLILIVVRKCHFSTEYQDGTKIKSLQNKGKRVVSQLKKIKGKVSDMERGWKCLQL